MELKVAIRTTQNFHAAAWAIFAKIRKGTNKGPDTPLTFLRSSAEPTTLIPHGPQYAPEIIKQLGEKWDHKHTSLEALEYAMDITGYGNRALPLDPDPDAWV